MCSLEVLPDPPSALTNLRAVPGTACRRECHRLSGDEYEGMPEIRMFRYEVQSNPRDTDLDGLDVVIRGDGCWVRVLGLLRGSSRYFLRCRGIRVERPPVVLGRSLGNFSCCRLLHRH